MTPGPLDPTTEAHDLQLAGLLAEMTEQFRRGQPPDVDSLLLQRPELGDELRALWATVQVAEELTRSAATEPSSFLAPATSPLASGQGVQEGGLRIVGDCELEEELGRGGMGVVYRARQVGLGRIVAIKILLRGSAASAIDVARFRAEAGSAARLDHPNIVPVHAVGDHEGRPYFIMRLIEGPTLASRLAGGPLPPHEAAAVLAPVCRAVDYAHRRGVLHRDLKPSNILIDRDGLPYVADFGLAKRVDIDTDAGLTSTGAVIGTPAYMSPEQAAGCRGRIGPGSDVYSLGTILYHMLTGRPPFQAASALDTLLLVLEQEPLPPRMLNPRADRDLGLIAMKCLQKPADLRYPTAAALAADLEAYLHGDPVSARSGRLTAIVTRALSETHHAAVLENWGLLWVWHSVVVLALCLITNLLQERGIRSPVPFVLIWTVGFGTWAAIFWALRRRGGPVTFVERQIAHVWGASMIGCFMLFGVEILMGLPVLALAPILAVFSGMVFLVKAGILSGAFYVPAAVMFLTSGLMALCPRFGLTFFGVAAGAGFFVPGLKYHRRHLRTVRAGRTAGKKIDEGC